MFVELKEYAERCDLNITISYKLDTMTVIVLPKTSEEQFQLSPIVLSGTPEDFDKGFVSSLKALLEPMAKKIDGLKIESKDFEESVEEIKKEEPKAKKAVKAVNKEEPKEPSFKDLMEQGDKAKAAKDYKTAVGLFYSATQTKPEDKKAKEKLEDARRWEKAQANIFDDVPDPIKEIAKESPNVMIVTPSPDTRTPIPDNMASVIAEMHSEEEFEGSGESEDNANFGDDEDDFNLNS